MRVSVKIGLERLDYFYLISSRCSSIDGQKERKKTTRVAFTSKIKDTITCIGTDRCSMFHEKYGCILKCGFTRKLPCN